MKETCTAIAATMTADGFEAPYTLVEKVGVLLISTISSLKHAGAAFVARDSLQEVAKVCMSSSNKDVSALPELWARRLLEEISSYEKVRESTLRRSTGYALGFLAIMRSEISSKPGSSTIIPRVLENILAFSLPPEEEVKLAFERLQLSDEVAAKPSEFFYSPSSTGSRRFFVPNGEYEVSRLTVVVVCIIHVANHICLRLDAVSML
jgi:hypothetical protein